MRNMARVVELESTTKMFEKDKIVLGHFKGMAYSAIIPKEGAEPGKLYAFIEADSILPEIERWEFLRKRSYVDKLQGFLIKPMKMGNEDFNGTKGEAVKSWGLAVSIDELPITEGEIRRLKEGDDLTEALNIRKYEPAEDASPVPEEGKKKYPGWVRFCLKVPILRWIGKLWQKYNAAPAGSFPTDLISKSDETTLQNMPFVLEKCADKDVIVTAKMEGKSMTIVPFFNGKKYRYSYPCSRNSAYVRRALNDFWMFMDSIHFSLKAEELWKTERKAYIIQGELVGPGIQSNIYRFDKLHLYVYTIKDYETRKQLGYYDMLAVARKLGLDVVPFLKTARLREIMPDLDTAVSFAEKASWIPKTMDSTMEPKGKIWKDYIQHEGVVVRTTDYDKDNGAGCSFKVKNFAYAERGLSKIAEDCRINRINNPS